MSGLINKAKAAVGGHSTSTTSTNAGPHESNVLNKADPRVDSDYDHRANPNSAIPGQGYGSTNAGPHGSNIANKLDPRYDSDLDHRANPGSNVPSGVPTHIGHTGQTGYTGTSGVPGATGTTRTTGTTGGVGSTGATGTTAGPHSSNVLNKLDPRVDSDLDGSKTIGGNRT